MNPRLLDEIIAAHGGAERWAQVRELTLKLRVGGNILALKFQSPRLRSLECIIDTRRIRAILTPFPCAGKRGVFESTGVRIESNEGIILAEREIIPDETGRVPRRMIWDDLDLLYFLGYALWNYAVTPYLFLWPGFECREGGTWDERDGLQWRKLHVRYPAGVPTHSRAQTFYFDDRGWLRRLDYTAYVFSDLARGAHLCEDHRAFEGLIFPTRRIVYPRMASG
ncbi:MAG TPA: hypothetical protein VJ810_19620, partial [Blastocatellia bacterium]|nr:hypothetical protein [Blastocatellia bacterium]